MSAGVTTREVVYLACPLGGDVAINAARARRWLRWLMDREPDVAFCCPWLPFVDVGNDDDDPYHARCLRDAIAIARRCNTIVLCGATISPGMRLELEAVLDAGGDVADLTCLVSSSSPSDPPAEWTPKLGPLALGRHRWSL